MAKTDGHWWRGVVQGPSFNTVAVPFIYGTTRPDTTNTGLAVNGLTTADLTVAGTPDLTINDAYVTAHGSTLDKLWVKGHINFTASSPVTITNSQIEGRAFTGTAPYDAIVHARSTSTPVSATLSFTNCVIKAVQPDVGICTAMGERLGHFDRCDLSLGSDIIDFWWTTGDSGTKSIRGCYLHDFSFWANDPKHTNDSVHPGWSHSDAIQMSGGDNILIEGNNIQHFAASGVGDYATLVGTGNYTNGAYGGCVMITPSGYTVTNLNIKNNWIHGGEGQIHLAVQSGGSYNSGNTMTCTGNRHGVDAHAAGPYSGNYNHIFYVWDNGMTSQAPTDVVSGAVYDTTPDVPAALRGTPLPAVQYISGATEYQSIYQTSTPYA